MAGAARAAGAILLIVGLTAMVGFSTYVLRDHEYAKAVLLRERNPGNVLYEARYGAAFFKRVVLVSGAVAGALVTLHGTTFLLLGALAARRRKSDPPAPRGRPGARRVD